MTRNERLCVRASWGCALLIVIPLTASRAHGQHFVIAPQNRVTVRGACMWSCVETVTRAHGVAAGKGIAEHMRRTTDGGARQADVRRELDRRGIVYDYAPPGSYDWKTLKHASQYGAVIGITTGPGPKDGHALVVTGISANNRTVFFWNPSAPHRIGTAPADRFKKDWFGNVLWIPPQNK